MDKINEITSVNEDEINIIKRQTNYTREQIVELMKKHNLKDILKIYMKNNTTTNVDTNLDRPVSKNQIIYKELRTFLNNISNERIEK